MIVSRGVSRTNFGDELLTQVLSRPVALALTAVFLGSLMLTPLPKTPLFMLLVATGGMAYFIKQGQAKRTQVTDAKKRAEPKGPDRVEEMLAVDPMELEVGYGLIKLVDRKQGGDLLDRIGNIRRQQASELGIVVPPIRIRDNIQLEPNQYAIKLRGVQIARGETLPGQFLAIDSGLVSEKISGMDTSEPAFGLPALWINEDQKQLAEHRNYTVVEASSVLATHLTEIIKKHADELLTRESVNRLLDNLKEKSPKVVEEVVPNVLKVGEIQKVMQSLLRERVPVRDLEIVLETLGDWAPRTKDPEVLTEYVRNALARTICQIHRSRDSKIHCLTLDPAIEDLVSKHLERSDRGTIMTMSPELQNRIAAAVKAEAEKAIQSSGGQTPIVLCSPQVRAWVRRIIESVLPQVAVLAFNEIVRGIEIESLGLVVLKNES
jgi:flagellar biosynthesis protein FlhA